MKAEDFNNIVPLDWEKKERLYPVWPEISIDRKYDTISGGVGLKKKNDRDILIVTLRTCLRVCVNGVWHKTCLSDQYTYDGARVIDDQLKRFLVQVYHHHVIADVNSAREMLNSDGDKVWTVDKDQRSELERLAQIIMGK